ncbi:MAG: ABC transporter substrate-binding protein [Butyrivibrio sp.]|nr:ABC transporter substrate-binding protein [Butyrivibrio sp.]
MKKLLSAVVLSTMFGTLLTGCSSASTETTASTASTAAEDKGDDSEVTFTIGFGQEPPSMDPQDFNTTACTLIGYDCYDTLLNFSLEGSELEPCLAESWEQIDETTYVYNIKKGVKFSDGNEMTMEDVLYSMERVKNDGYSMSYLFDSVDHFEVDEEAYTLTVYLTQADATWKYVPATSPCTIVEKAVVEAEGDNYGTLSGSCVGTGPYMLSSWDSGTEIVLVKNPYYWNDPESLDVDKVVYEVIEDATSRALAAQSGQIDYARSLSSETLPTYESASGMSITSYSGTNASYVALNCSVAPFDDVNARKAVAYCIDKESYTAIIGGKYSQAKDAFFMPSSMYAIDTDAWTQAGAEATDYNQDYAKAAEALAASKYADGFEFTLYTTAALKTGAEMIQSMITESGLPITCKIVEIQSSESFAISYGYTVDENGNRVYNALMTGWISDWLDPTGYLTNCLAGRSNYQGGANKSAYSSSEFDSYLDESYLLDDDAARSELMLKAMEVAVEDCPVIPLYESLDTYIISDRFEYEEGANFFWNFTVADVHVKE